MITINDDYDNNGVIFIRFQSAKNNSFSYIQLCLEEKS